MTGDGCEAPSSASRGGTSSTTRVTARVSDEAKAELRRFKNREAARRVRERKTTALNSFKGRVDDLKRVNQKLLQIIAQLRGASLSAPCLSGGGDGGGSAVMEALVADATANAAGLTAPASATGGGGDTSLDSGPSALAPPRLEPRALSDSQRAQLEPFASCPAGAVAAIAAAQQHHHHHSGSVLQQQQQQQQAALAAVHSAPLTGLLLAAPASLAGGAGGRAGAPTHPDALHLRRACGCLGDDECDECEGVRVTLRASHSSLPLVSTPGPRPRALTLDDLQLGELSASGNVLCSASATSAPLFGAGGAFVLLQPQLSIAQQRRQQHHYFQQQQRPLAMINGADAMGLELVETLEPSARQQRHHHHYHAAQPHADGHNSSGNAVFGGGGGGGDGMAAAAAAAAAASVSASASGLALGSAGGPPGSPRACGSGSLLRGHNNGSSTGNYVRKASAPRGPPAEEEHRRLKQRRSATAGNAAVGAAALASNTESGRDAAAADDDDGDDDDLACAADVNAVRFVPSLHPSWLRQQFEHEQQQQQQQQQLRQQQEQEQQLHDVATAPGAGVGGAGGLKTATKQRRLFKSLAAAVGFGRRPGGNSSTKGGAPAAAPAATSPAAGRATLHLGAAGGLAAPPFEARPSEDDDAYFAVQQMLARQRQPQQQQRAAATVAAPAAPAAPARPPLALACSGAGSATVAETLRAGAPLQDTSVLLLPMLPQGFSDAAAAAAGSGGDGYLISEGSGGDFAAGFWLLNPAADGADAVARA